MERYEKSVIKKTIKGKQFYKGKIYPDIPFSDTDVYVITTIGDRLDSLANSYYKNSELWWVISVANNHITKGSLFPIPGTQLRIPTNINYVMFLFDNLNGL
jgi:hypothetical protein